jgi:threonine dehydratase
MTEKLQPSAVLEAALRLDGIVNRTPVMTSRTLNERTGCEIFLKCENFQRVGAFKFRGAYNAISQLSKEQKEAGVITHSSGNHAQGMALAARLLGVKAVIVMPEDAPETKRAATAGYGAQIVPCKAIDREDVTASLVADKGYVLIHPYDNDNIILGQGTAALELFDEVGKLDALFVPVGGGGLISGSALAASAVSPGCHVIGVEPEIAADANRSWHDGRLMELDHVPQTIADGLRTRYIGERNFKVMRDYVHDMVTVSETEILETLTFIWTYLKIIVEPSSAVALAPLLNGRYELEDRRVGIILSGGNAKLPDFESLLGHQVHAAPSEAVAPLKTLASDPHLRPRVLVTCVLDAPALDVLRNCADVDIDLELGREALLQRIPNYQVLIVGPQQQVDSQLIEYAYGLQIIGCISSHLDNINVSTARDMGIQMCYVPAGNAVAIAEHTMARLLLLADRFGDGQLAGKTLGLIGFGHVSQQVAQRARAFDMKVIANQPRLTPELVYSTGVEATDLVDLLRRADYVSLHVPFTEETQSIIGASELAQMKKTAFLINSGHTELVDEVALFFALDAGRVAGAALSRFPEEIGVVDPVSIRLRRHERTIVSEHVTSIIKQQRPSLALTVASKIAELLSFKQIDEALALELVPVKQVTPHEQIDDKRVVRLMSRLEEDGRLVNPPITTYWKGRYVILDGATRFASFRRLGYQYIIVQLVNAQQSEFELHTWYHAISHKRQTLPDLLENVAAIDGLRLIPLSGRAIRPALQDSRTLCYFMNREGGATLAQETERANRLAVMNDLVDVYTRWGDVERTLVTDLPRLLAQFPHMQAVAVFPQFKPEEVFDAASGGEFLPAGLTRFVIPGRILRLNADLRRLKADEPLSAKRAWFNQFLAEKLARSRLRYYQEPVILLDE